MKLFSEEQEKIAANTDLVLYINKTEGFTFSRSGKYARCHQHDSLVINNGNFFNWHSKGTRGNAINFVMEHQNYPFKQAMIHLLEFNNVDHVLDEDAVYTTTNKNTGGSVTISKEDIRKAYAYLIKRRGISKDIVDELVNEGLLLMSKEEGLPSNIAFNIKAPDETNAGYEVHGTYDLKKYKGCIPDKKGRQYGFNIRIGKPEKAYLFESAIDLISFYQMWKHKNPRTMKDIILISLSGLKEGVIEAMQKDFNIKELVLCVDNDDAGANFQKVLLNKGFEFKVMKVPEGYKDWNEYLTEGRAVYN
jgi:hypothetical protein